MAGYAFDARSVRRIARSVLATEGERKNPQTRRRRFVTARSGFASCKSSDAAELPAYGVVEIDDEETLETTETIVYVVKKIGTTWPKRVAVLGPDPLAPGAYGELTFAPTWVLCDDGAVPGPKEAWGIKPNETKLFKGYPGFRSLGRATGTGAEQRALMRQAWPQILWAVAGSNIPARSGATPGSGTVTIQTLASGSFASTGFTTTAKNASGAQIIAGKYLQIVEIEENWAGNYEDCAGG